MRRKNKVNPNHYKVAGRLSPDDLARERMKQNARQDSKAWHERQVPDAAWTVAAGASQATRPRRTPAAGSRFAPRVVQINPAGAVGPRRAATRPRGQTRAGPQRSPFARGPVAAARAPRMTARKEMPPRARAARNKRQMTATGGARAAKGGARAAKKR